MKRNGNEGGGTTPTPDEALAWLKESGQTPDLSVTWDILPTEDAVVMNAILDILFRPRRRPNAA